MRSFCRSYLFSCSLMPLSGYALWACVYCVLLSAPPPPPSLLPTPCKMHVYMHLVCFRFVSSISFNANPFFPSSHSCLVFVSASPSIPPFIPPVVREARRERHPTAWCSDFVPVLPPPTPPTLLLLVVVGLCAIHHRTSGGASSVTCSLGCCFSLSSWCSCSSPSFSRSFDHEAQLRARWRIDGTPAHVPFPSFFLFFCSAPGTSPCLCITLPPLPSPSHRSTGLSPANTVALEAMVSPRAPLPPPPSPVTRRKEATG